MKVVGIVPYKGGEGVKSRLALPREQRYQLGRKLLNHVVTVVARTPIVSDFRVVSPELLGGISTLADDGQGLNQAVALGLAWATSVGADVALIVCADLPQCSEEDLTAVLAALPPRPGGVIAPSKDGGTGAIAVKPPSLLIPSYGPDSARIHKATLERHGGTVEILDRPGLAFDVDVPEDLRILASQQFLDVPGRACRQDGSVWGDGAKKAG